MSGLNVFKIFQSIQGESSYAGLPFVFIRLAGCNLRCAWCDTQEAQKPSKTTLSVASIIEIIKNIDIPRVCVTGGEPLLQSGTIDLLKALLEEKSLVTLETNGSLPINRVPENVRIILDIKCPGSGMSEFMVWNNLDRLRDHDEIKFVVADRKDYEYAVNIYAKYPGVKKNSILIYPVWNKLHVRTLAKWVLADKMAFRVCCQFHKICGCP